MYYYVADFRTRIYEGHSAFSQLSIGAITREIVGNVLNNHHYKMESSAIFRRSNSFYNNRTKRQR